MVPVGLGTLSGSGAMQCDRRAGDALPRGASVIPVSNGPTRRADVAGLISPTAERFRRRHPVACSRRAGAGQAARSRPFFRTRVAVVVCVDAVFQ
jgi:hypothetical protein